MDTQKFAPWNTLHGVTLSPPVLSFLTNKLGFQGAAPVQSSVIPLILSKGRDVVVEAITGSGKTLAFLIPAVELLLNPRYRTVCKENKHSVIAAALFPTRELAHQVHAIAFQMIRYVNTTIKEDIFSEACFVGGHAVGKDIAAFQSKGANILLGTPGRLNELLVTCRESSSCFDLRNFEMLILDEADRLLDMGFRPTLNSLLKRFPRQRRTALFSATQSRELADLARAGTRNPLLVTVKEQANLQQQQNSNSNSNSNNNDINTNTNESATSATSSSNKTQIPTRLVNYYQVSKYGDKIDHLVQYLRPIVKNSKTLIYVVTCASCEWLHAALSVIFAEDILSSSSSSNKNNNQNNNNQNNKFSLYALHGQLSMDQRKKVYKAASGARAATMICSDVAARGLDLPSVGHVIQFDAPTDPRTFVHRIGRTARMGQSGQSLIFLSPIEIDYLPFLELQNLHLEKWKTPKNNNEEDQKVDGDEDAEENDDDDDDDDEDNDDDIDFSANIVVDKRRTMQSSIADRNKLRAAKGRLSTIAKKRQQLKQERRSVVTRGDLCKSPCILRLRRSVAFENNTSLLNKAVRAFVSFIRAYKEHECRNIFRLQLLDVTDLVNGFALFFVPNCGEIRLMNTLYIPLQPEFKTYTQELDRQRKSAQAERFATAQQQQKKREQYEDNAASSLLLEEGEEVEKGGDGDGTASAAALLLDNNNEDNADNNTINATAGNNKMTHQSTVHEKAKAEKDKIRTSKMSQNAKKRAWAEAELAELRREAFLIKQEKRGRLSKKTVDQLIGNDALDNAMMSSRERKFQKRRRSRSE